MKRMRATTGVLWTLLGVLVFCGACSHNSTTEPSNTTTTTTTTAAAPTVTETFNGTLPVAGFKFYTFNIAVNGTVNVTIAKVSGTGVPATVQLGIGIGQPSGTDCSTTITQTAGAATLPTPHASGTFGPGLFCVRVSDVGNLFAPATFAVTIAHP